MPDRVVSSSKLTAIANAIRTKAGTQSSMTLDEMPTAIANIPSGGGAIDLTGCTGSTWIAEAVKHFDTSGMTNMNYMFGATLTSGPQDYDLSSWDVSNVTTMNQMFEDCTGIRSLDLDGWNTSNCIYMNSFLGYAFYDGVACKLWVPSTFVATRVSDNYRKPFYAAPNTTVDVFTNATDAATQGWGTIDSSFVMHYNATHQDFLNA